MSKYSDLLSVLDSLCDEAPQENCRYHLDKNDIPKLEQMRSRAFVHLLLKVKFGIIEFADRERCLTDGPNDGGIDAYYIDKENKRLYFIQSKFRNTSVNFENKEISYDDLFAMDINRILNGEDKDIKGNQYNGKICQLQRDLQGINDLARYEYRVLLLANLREKIQSKLDKIIGKYPIEIYNFEKVYSELLFPIVCGTFFEPKELTIVLTVNRESCGSRIQYYPETQFGLCTVNVQFVPTIEVGRILYQYKNSILRFNPRSYLELNSGSINAKIRDSILYRDTNEFALFNNGITMISDETAYSDTVGRKNTALLTLTNPQIINGGQTAFTLSRIYEEALKSGNMNVFDGKEVLLKVISFNTSENALDNNTNDNLTLIEEISTATNQQTPVQEADRRANDKVQIELQSFIFKDFGMYYERKRGEFADGIRNKYIQRNQIVDREVFLRCCIAVSPNPVLARQRSVEKLFSKMEFNRILPDSASYKRYMYAFKSYFHMSNSFLIANNVKQYARYAIVCTVTNLFYSDSLDVSQFDALLPEHINSVVTRWDSFEEYVRGTIDNRNRYFKETRDSETNEIRIDANWQGYYKGKTIITDLRSFFDF